ncbi:MAG TPA: ribosome maturation factor RimP [Sedimentibacter sp.]|jgi:ribosome maturation factor RimP|nr:ribosome maturation factor RimP [Sedimentibacter sp.]NLA14835.1 ribosome maturation factor RimP [Tissierellia bacterium]HAS91173.1 ribosome maturation factor RimP [Clostridiales bacterium]HOA19905.1 ribosome maturation factor RimP [Sedimentibacter sp.]HOG63067.1 ribosome maturation factor RimP [Sedimentibacter sp.]
MNKKDIVSSVRKITEEILKSTDIELFDIEYVKEGPFKYLKVYIDKPGGITVDDTADISRVLNKKLDEVDLIKEQYFLEVSSPGVERPFKTEKDYLKNLNKLVEARLYKPIDDKKTVKGILTEKNENNIVIKSGENNFTIELKDLAKINRVIEDF